MYELQEQEAVRLFHHKDDDHTDEVRYPLITIHTQFPGKILSATFILLNKTPDKSTDEVRYPLITIHTQFPGKALSATFILTNKSPDYSINSQNI